MLDAKLTKRADMTMDDLMPDYDSGSDYEYDETEDLKVDKMGNTIIDPEDEKDGEEDV